MGICRDQLTALRSFASVAWLLSLVKIGCSW